MSSKKIYFGLIALIIVLAIGAGAAVYFGNGILEKTSVSLVELKSEKKVIDEQNKALIQAKKDLEKYSELESIAKKIVPQDKDQAKSVREIVAIAETNSVSISSITFPNSTLGNPQPKASKTEDGSTQDKTKTTPPVSQVESADGLKGVYKLELTIQSDDANPITYTNLINFLAALENNRRTAQVSNITITPENKNPSLLTFTITINVFIKP